MRLLKTCRVCGSEDLIEYLNLGLMPLSNNLLSKPHDVADRYPLALNFCESCGLSQLSTMIDPKTLFSHYVYRSSISQGYKDHCKQMAIDLATMYKLHGDFLHIDIAGNDGALLRVFQEIYDHKILNVDPASNLKKIAEDAGVPTLTEFWCYPTAVLVNHRHGPAQLITATNVFAHVDKIYDFLRAVRDELTYDGVAVFEFPYLVDFILRNEFDTVYFEHLSYFLVGPLKYAASRVGLGITHISHHEIHGGSLRIVMQKNRKHDNIVEEFINQEKTMGFYNSSIYFDWKLNVMQVIKQFREFMVDCAAKEIRVYGFAASAKGNTLLNSAGITQDHMVAIFDETPEKWNKFSPGTGIPIYPLHPVYGPMHTIEYMVLLSWNFAKECMAKCHAAGFTGKFVLPLTMEII